MKYPKGIEIMNDQGKWATAHFVLEYRTTEFERKNYIGVTEEWETLRYCDTREMAERELAGYKTGVWEDREFRIRSIG